MKKIVTAVLSMVLIMATTSAAFAVQDNINYAINSVEDVSKSVKSLSADGTLYQTDKSFIFKNAAPEAVEAYITGIIEESLKLAKELSGTVEFEKVKSGKAYERQIFELPNGCTLTMEFEEGIDAGTDDYMHITSSVIKPMASNGETMWKDYGNRYFTAKATVNVGLGAGSVSLENHYILSAQGIDENYGVAIANPSGAIPYGTIEANGYVVTDASARTVGASDVNMYGRFKITKYGGSVGDIVTEAKLSTSVGYVDHNTSAKQIKVKHSWSLS